MAFGLAHTRTRSIAVTLLLVFACFTFSTSGYLAWLYHLMEFAPAISVDGVSIGLGYTLQGAGIALAAIASRLWPGSMGRVPLVVLIALHFACAAPAALSESLEGTLAFGCAMNVLCGFISMFYLLCLASLVEERRRGIVFGAGYACSVVASWLLSMADSPFAGISVELVSCIVFSVIAAAVALAVPLPFSTGDSEAGDAEAPRPAKADAQSAFPLQTVALAAITVLLMSMVKNMGFSFPSADIGQTVSLETSRLFYAMGLVIAGLVVDRSRKLGSILCMASLIVPFVMLALVNEPVSSAVFWAIGYFFFGFFSVFRVVLFADLAADADDRYLFLAGFGLMFGHLGDALGTVVCLSLGGSVIALVTVTAALFAVTVFVFYQLFKQVYIITPAPERSERERFDAFAANLELSPRERDVLRLVLDGKTNSEVAEALFVSDNTVKFHMRNLLKKADCKNRSELQAKYAGK